MKLVHLTAAKQFHVRKNKKKRSIATIFVHEDGYEVNKTAKPKKDKKDLTTKISLEKDIKIYFNEIDANSIELMSPIPIIHYKVEVKL